MKKQNRSASMASIHETAEGLHAAGLMDKRTMREFDELCLTTTGLVSQWEHREKRPQGTSLKLLSLVANHGLQAVA